MRCWPRNPPARSPGSSSAMSATSWVTGEPERVGRPVDAGLGVEQAAGGGAVEARAASTATSSRSPASNDSPSLIQRMRCSGSACRTRRHALHHEAVGDEGGVRAGVEHLEQVAGVVDVVVGQEDPADVVRVDDGERGLEPLPSRVTAGPQSTMTGSAPVITIELTRWRRGRGPRRRAGGRRACRGRRARARRIGWAVLGSWGSSASVGPTGSVGVLACWLQLSHGPVGVLLEGAWMRAHRSAGMRAPGAPWRRRRWGTCDGAIGQRTGVTRR